MKRLEGIRAGLVALALTLLLFAALVYPLRRAWQGMQQELAELAAQGWQLRQAVAAEQAVSRAAGGGGGNGERYYANESSTALVAAAVQQRVKALVGRAGVQLVSTEAREPRRVEGHEQVPVSVRVRGDYAAMVRLVYEIERARPLLFIDRLLMQGGRNYRFGPVSGQAGEARPAVDLSLDISAWRALGQKGGG